MDPNQNPPSERDWTEQEREEFFASTDAITGLPNGSLAGAWASNGAANWTNASKPTGIHVTAITPPEQGWPVAFYCPICKETTFLLSPWAIKPKEADYIKMNDTCASDEFHYMHTMVLIMERSREAMLKAFWEKL